MKGARSIAHNGNNLAIKIFKVSTQYLLVHIRMRARTRVLALCRQKESRDTAELEPTSPDDSVEGANPSFIHGLQTRKSIRTKHWEAVLCIWHDTWDSHIPYQKAGFQSWLHS